MTFPNILKNPGLENWYERQKGYDHQWKLVVIEQPFDWEYVYIPGLETSKTNPPDKDYWRIPQSLHWDSGMKIAAGWMVWQAGYKQRVTVKAGQRYAAIARFYVTISGTQDPNAVQWMFYSDGLTPAQSQWSAYSGTQLFGQPVEHQFVFQADTDGIVDLTFWGRCQWADNAAEMFIRSIELVEVPQDYGEAAPVIPFPEDTTEPGGTIPEPIPTYELLGCHPISWLYQLLGKNAAQAFRAQRTELYPGWDAWLFPLFLFVCLAVAIAAVISFIQPHVAAQGVNLMEGIMSIQQAGELLVAMVAAIIAGGSSSVVFTPLVNLVKFLLKAVGQEGLISANGINILVSGGVVLVAFFSRYLGVELQAQSLMEWLAGVIPLVITGIALFTGNKYMYSYAQKIKMPVFNYKRS